MANITKRTARRLRSHLAAGENVEIAVLVESRGTLGAASAAMVVAPRTTMRALERRAAERAGGIAASFPASSAVVAVTDRRILVAPSNGLTFSEPVLDLAPGGLRLVEHRSNGLGRRLVFRFADSSTIEVDASRGQPFERLAAALGRVG